MFFFVAGDRNASGCAFTGTDGCAVLVEKLQEAAVAARGRRFEILNPAVPDT
ncbi:MAG TPA: hypothetical protein VKR53_12480 [Puia sp.]|nr:hypothetical protein [Puia sp.]